MTSAVCLSLPVPRAPPGGRACFTAPLHPNLRELGGPEFLSLYKQRVAGGVLLPECHRERWSVSTQVQSSPGGAERRGRSEASVQSSLLLGRRRVPRSCFRLRLDFWTKPPPLCLPEQPLPGGTVGNLWHYWIVWAVLEGRGLAEAVGSGPSLPI